MWASVRRLSLQKSNRPKESFSPLSSGSNNNTYLQACEDQIKDWRRTVCAAELQDIFCGYQVRWLPWNLGQMGHWAGAELWKVCNSRADGGLEGSSDMDGSNPMSWVEFWWSLVLWKQCWPGSGGNHRHKFPSATPRAQVPLLCGNCTAHVLPCGVLL